MVGKIVAVAVIFTAIAAPVRAQDNPDDKAKKILERIEQVVSEHYRKLSGEIAKAIKQEFAKQANAGDVEKQLDAFFADIVPSMKDDGVTGAFKKFLQGPNGRPWLQQKITTAITKKGIKMVDDWVNAIFEQKDGTYVVRKEFEGQLKQMLASVPDPKKKEAYLGIILDDTFDDAKRKDLKLESGEGVKLSAVKAGGPAEKSGLKAGHVLIKINGDKVTEGSFREMMSKFAPGNEIEITVITEDGKQEKIKVVLAERN